ncbi:MAG: DNA-3-methyladenine glycosylase 2 family protein [Acidimicrobiales bacterium]|jgi:DNA-3-methyladenine glycosylase II|nr:DNA-3-methyladenine glycosylase 2 family protein [Acidimicrobiales bacterium]
MRVRRHHREAMAAVSAADPVMAALVERHGPVRLERPAPVAARFERLAHSIVHQQLAGAAARSIWERTRTAVGGDVTADALLGTDPEALRAAGLSGAKLAALVDLAAHVADGRVRLDRVGRRDDDAVVAELVQVRGIGPWTAQMFLMFALDRPDVWPVGDLGVRNGWGRAYGWATPPTPGELEVLGDRFRPHRSVAAWYLWAAADGDD